MTGSTAPGSAAVTNAPTDGHPVHRATALLEHALYRPSHAPAATGPGHPTNPPIEAADTSQDPATPGADADAPHKRRLADAARQLRTPAPPRVDVSALDTSSIPEDDAETRARDVTVHKQLRGLADAFHDRQRHANLIVAASVTAAILLTLCGLLLLFGATSEAGPKESATLHDQHRKASQPPLAADNAHDAGAKVVEAHPGRPLVLGALIPHRSARYVLLRRLPGDATLSAGHPAGDGSWMVKGEDVAGLMLTFAETANGDHPIEIYLLDSARGLQARQQLTLRVGARPGIYAADLSFGLANFLVETAKDLAPHDVDARPNTPARMTPARTTTPQAAKARQSLSRADMNAARRELTDRARDGHADAAYRLALTYDQEVLAKAGLTGIEGDTKTATSWYERAAKAGHSDAARRLEAIVTPRSGA